MAENTQLIRPAAGENRAVPVGPDARLEFTFNQGDADLSKDGQNLVLVFEDGGTITLEGFYDNFGDDAKPPTLIVEGAELPGEAFLVALNNPDLMPAAGPAAGPAMGGGTYEDALLRGVDGVDKLDKLGWDGWGRATERAEELQGQEWPGGTFGLAGNSYDMSGMFIASGIYEDWRPRQHVGDDDTKVYGKLDFSFTPTGTTVVDGIHLSGFTVGSIIVIGTPQFDADGNLTNGVTVTSPGQIFDFTRANFDADGVYILPPPNSDVDMNISVTLDLRATSSGITDIITGSFTIIVDAVADLSSEVISDAGGADAQQYVDQARQEIRDTDERDAKGWETDSFSLDYSQVQYGFTVSISTSFRDLDGSERHFVLVEHKDGWSLGDLPPGYSYAGEHIGSDGKSYFKIEVDDRTQGTVELDVPLYQTGLSSDISVALKTGSYVEETLGTGSGRDFDLTNNVAERTDGTQVSYSVDLINSTLTVRTGWASEGNNDAKYLGKTSDGHEYTGAEAESTGNLADGRTNIGAPIIFSLAGAEGAAEVITQIVFTFDDSRGSLWLDGVEYHSGDAVPVNSANLDNLYFVPATSGPQSYNDADVGMQYQVTVSNGAATHTFSGASTVIIDAVADLPVDLSGAASVTSLQADTGTGEAKEITVKAGATFHDLDASEQHIVAMRGIPTDWLLNADSIPAGWALLDGNGNPVADAASFLAGLADLGAHGTYSLSFDVSQAAIAGNGPVSANLSFDPRDWTSSGIKDADGNDAGRWSDGTINASGDAKIEIKATAEERNLSGGEYDRGNNFADTGWQALNAIKVVEDTPDAVAVGRLFTNEQTGVDSGEIGWGGLGAGAQTLIQGALGLASAPALLGASATSIKYNLHSDGRADGAAGGAQGGVQAGFYVDQLPAISAKIPGDVGYAPVTYETTTDANGNITIVGSFLNNAGEKTTALVITVEPSTLAGGAGTAAVSVAQFTAFEHDLPQGVLSDRNDLSLEIKLILRDDDGDTTPITVTYVAKDDVPLAGSDVKAVFDESQVNIEDAGSISGNVLTKLVTDHDASNDGVKYTAATSGSDGWHGGGLGAEANAITTFDVSIVVTPAKAGLVYTLQDAEGNSAGSTGLTPGVTYTILDERGEAQGSFSLGVNGDWVFSKDAGQDLLRSFDLKLTYTVQDADGDRSTASLEVAVKGAPVLVGLTGDRQVFESVQGDPADLSKTDTAGVAEYTLRAYSYEGERISGELIYEDITVTLKVNTGTASLADLDLAKVQAMNPGVVTGVNLTTGEITVKIPADGSGEVQLRLPMSDDSLGGYGTKSDGPTEDYTLVITKVTGDSPNNYLQPVNNAYPKHPDISASQQTTIIDDGANVSKEIGADGEWTGMWIVDGYMDNRLDGDAPYKHGEVINPLDGPMFGLRAPNPTSVYENPNAGESKLAQIRLSSTNPNTGAAYSSGNPAETISLEMKFTLTGGASADDVTVNTNAVAGAVYSYQNASGAWVQISGTANIPNAAFTVKPGETEPSVNIKIDLGTNFNLANTGSLGLNVTVLDDNIGKEQGEGFSVALTAAKGGESSYYGSAQHTEILDTFEGSLTLAGGGQLWEGGTFEFTFTLTTDTKITETNTTPVKAIVFFGGHADPDAASATFNADYVLGDVNDPTSIRGANPNVSFEDLSGALIPGTTDQYYPEGTVLIAFPNSVWSNLNSAGEHTYTLKVPTLHDNQIAENDETLTLTFAPYPDAVTGAEITSWGYEKDADGNDLIPTGIIEDFAAVQLTYLGGGVAIQTIAEDATGTAPNIATYEVRWLHDTGAGKGELDKLIALDMDNKPVAGSDIGFDITLKSGSAVFDYNMKDNWARGADDPGKDANTMDFGWAVPKVVYDGPEDTIGKILLDSKGNPVSEPVEYGDLRTPGGQAELLNAFNAYLKAAFGVNEATGQQYVEAVGVLPLGGNAGCSISFTVREGAPLDTPLLISAAAIDDRLTENTEAFSVQISNIRGEVAGMGENVTIDVQREVTTWIGDDANTAGRDGYLVGIKPADSYEGTGQLKLPITLFDRDANGNPIDIKVDSNGDPINWPAQPMIIEMQCGNIVNGVNQDTATLGEDYYGVDSKGNYSVTIPAGTAGWEFVPASGTPGTAGYVPAHFVAKDAHIPLNDDRLTEGYEIVTVTLTNVVNDGARGIGNESSLLTAKQIADHELGPVVTKTPLGILDDASLIKGDVDYLNGPQLVSFGPMSQVSEPWASNVDGADARGYPIVAVDNPDKNGRGTAIVKVPQFDSDGNFTHYELEPGLFPNKDTGELEPKTNHKMPVNTVEWQIGLDTDAAQDMLVFLNIAKIEGPNGIWEQFEPQWGNGTNGSVGRIVDGVTEKADGVFTFTVEMLQDMYPAYGWYGGGIDPNGGQYFIIIPEGKAAGSVNIDIKHDHDDSYSYLVKTDPVTGEPMIGDDGKPVYVYVDGKKVPIADDQGHDQAIDFVQMNITNIQGSETVFDKSNLLEWKVEKDEKGHMILGDDGKPIYLLDGAGNLIPNKDYYGDAAFSKEMIRDDNFGPEVSVTVPPGIGSDPTFVLQVEMTARGSEDVVVKVTITMASGGTKDVFVTIPAGSKEGSITLNSDEYKGTGGNFFYTQVTGVTGAESWPNNNVNVTKFGEGGGSAIGVGLGPVPPITEGQDAINYTMDCSFGDSRPIGPFGFTVETVHGSNALQNASSDKDYTAGAPGANGVTVLIPAEIMQAMWDAGMRGEFKVLIQPNDNGNDADGNPLPRGPEGTAVLADKDGNPFPPGTPWGDWSQGVTDLPMAKIDGMIEGDEGFTCIITNLIGAVGGNVSEETYIIDVDKPQVLLIYCDENGNPLPLDPIHGTPTGREGGDDVYVKIVLVNQLYDRDNPAHNDALGNPLEEYLLKLGNGEAEFQFTVSGTAKDGTDFILHSETVTISSRESVSDLVKISLPDDYQTEDPLSLTLSVSADTEATRTNYPTTDSAGNPGVFLPDSDAYTMTIIDFINGPTIQQLEANVATVAEGGAVIYTLVLDRALEQKASLTFKVDLNVTNTGAQSADTAQAFTADDIQSVTVNGLTLLMSDILNNNVGGKAWIGTDGNLYFNMDMRSGLASQTFTVTTKNDFITEGTENMKLSLVATQGGELTVGDANGKPVMNEATGNYYQVGEAGAPAAPAITVTVTDVRDGPTISLTNSPLTAVEGETAVVLITMTGNAMPAGIAAPGYVGHAGTVDDTVLTLNLPANVVKNVLDGTGDITITMPNGGALVLGPDDIKLTVNGNGSGTVTFTLPAGVPNGAQIHFPLQDNAIEGDNTSFRVSLSGVTGGEAIAMSGPGYSGKFVNETPDSISFSVTTTYNVSCELTLNVTGMPAGVNMVDHLVFTVKGEEYTVYPQSASNPNGFTLNANGTINYKVVDEYGAPIMISGTNIIPVTVVFNTDPDYISETDMALAKLNTAVGGALSGMQVNVRVEDDFGRYDADGNPLADGPVFSVAYAGGAVAEGKDVNFTINPNPQPGFETVQQPEGVVLTFKISGDTFSGKVTVSEGANNYPAVDNGDGTFSITLPKGADLTKALTVTVGTEPDDLIGVGSAVGIELVGVSGGEASLSGNTQANASITESSSGHLLVAVNSNISVVEGGFIPITLNLANASKHGAPATASEDVTVKFVMGQGNNNPDMRMFLDNEAINTLNSTGKYVMTIDQLLSDGSTIQSSVTWTLEGGKYYFTATLPAGESGVVVNIPTYDNALSGGEFSTSFRWAGTVDANGLVNANGQPAITYSGNSGNLCNVTVTAEPMDGWDGPQFSVTAAGDVAEGAAAVFIIDPNPQSGYETSEEPITLTFQISGASFNGAVTVVDGTNGGYTAASLGGSQYSVTLPKGTDLNLPLTVSAGTKADNVIGTANPISLTLIKTVGGESSLSADQAAQATVTEGSSAYLAVTASTLSAVEGEALSFTLALQNAVTGGVMTAAKDVTATFEVPAGDIGLFLNSAAISAAQGAGYSAGGLTWTYDGASYLVTATLAAGAPSVTISIPTLDNAISAPSLTGSLTLKSVGDNGLNVSLDAGNKVFTVTVKDDAGLDGPAFTVAAVGDVAEGTPAAFTINPNPQSGFATSEEAITLTFQINGASFNGVVTVDAGMGASMKVYDATDLGGGTYSITLPVGTDLTQPLTVKAGTEADNVMGTSKPISLTLVGTTGGESSLGAATTAKSTVTEGSEATLVVNAASSHDVVEGENLNFTLALRNAVTGDPMTAAMPIAAIFAVAASGIGLFLDDARAADVQSGNSYSANGLTWTYDAGSGAYHVAATLAAGAPLATVSIPTVYNPNGIVETKAFATLDLVGVDNGGLKVSLDSENAAGFPVAVQDYEHWAAQNAGLDADALAASQTSLYTLGADDQLGDATYLYDASGVAGDQVILGTSGADVIYASQGDNILIGGDGADIFAWNSANMTGGKTVIMDFDHREDQLRFDDLFGGGATGQDMLENLLDHSTWTPDEGATGGTLTAGDGTTFQLSVDQATATLSLQVSFAGGNSQTVELQGFDAGAVNFNDEAVVAELLTELITVTTS